MDGENTSKANVAKSDATRRELEAEAQRRAVTAEKLKVCKIDVDANQDLAAKYKVETIPTLVVFEGGKEVKRSVGVQPKPAILAMLK